MTMTFQEWMTNQIEMLGPEEAAKWLIGASSRDGGGILHLKTQYNHFRNEFEMGYISPRRFLKMFLDRAEALWGSDGALEKLLGQMWLGKFPRDRICQRELLGGLLRFEELEEYNRTIFGLYPTYGLIADVEEQANLVDSNLRHDRIQSGHTASIFHEAALVLEGIEFVKMVDYYEETLHTDELFNEVPRYSTIDSGKWQEALWCKFGEPNYTEVTYKLDLMNCEFTVRYWYDEDETSELVRGTIPGRGNITPGHIRRIDGLWPWEETR